MNEWTATQMLAMLVGDYRFKHSLTAPGLAPEASLLMHPSEVLNWMVRTPRATTVSGDSA